MSLTIQPKLLRALETMEINGWEAPPLRERKEDIPELVENFTTQFCRQRKISNLSYHPHTIEILMDYHWPSNIRQLKNLVEKIVVLSEEAEILPDMIRRHLPLNGSEQNAMAARQRETLEEAKKRIERKNFY
jgi:DNA-binding NtrC family response regulator